MIAAHENFSQLSRSIGYFVRTRAIAHDVTQIQHQVVSRSTRQAGIKGFEIRVNVAKKKYAHESPDKPLIIVPEGAREQQSARFVVSR